MEKSVFISIQKKNNAKEYPNYSTVVLISHASMLMLKILQARFQQYMSQELPDVKAGFRNGRRTRDQLANIRWIMEKARTLQKKTSTFTSASLITLNDCVSSVQFSCSVVSDSLRPHESQHARPPCPSPTPGAYSNSCPSSQRCHPAISSSVVPFSSCPQSLPAPESFSMSQLFAWGGQSTGASASASFLPKNTQGWSPSEWTGWI